MIGYPEKQGLYDPKFEHDACGIGFISNIKGKKSHKIVDDALEILLNLVHRGGIGAEEDSGDGAGILFQVPHKFFNKVCKNLSINLPNEGEYGVGMLFLSPDEDTRNKSLDVLKSVIKKEGQELLGIRPVPTNKESLGQMACDSLPFICQVFVGKGDKDMDNDDFERKLFMINKISELEIRNNDDPLDKYFYFASFSRKTIVYKGMLMSRQVNDFYIDLKDVDIESSIALVHSRYSTNTFPSWERAHPNRIIVHNGEINTINGNVNWAMAREHMLYSEKFGDSLNKVFPIINEDGSDSAILDNYLSLLTLSGISLPEAVMMLIPEPWEKDKTMDEKRRAYYEYNSCLLEPWDGPAAVAFSDGDIVGATLDRNGLRPARYYILDDDTVILASETGALSVDPKLVSKKGMLMPGKMLLVDTINGKVLEDDEIKENIVSDKPYDKWVKENLITLDKLEEDKVIEVIEDNFDLLTLQKVFGFTYEDVNLIIKGMLEQEKDPITAMGADVPLAVLSDRPQKLYNYFKQLFAQVTNPPIDAIREKIVTSSYVLLGGSTNILVRKAENARKLKLDTPVISNKDMKKIKGLNTENFKSAIIPIVFKANKMDCLGKALNIMFDNAMEAIEDGANILVLSDKGFTKDCVPIPALLATSALHHYLIKNNSRMKVSIVVESGDVMEVHHYACLIGYGASGINAYLAYDTIKNLIDTKTVDKDLQEAYEIFDYAISSGITKILSKMGISTIQSYQGAQIFEAIGINELTIKKYFTGTVSRIGGIGLSEIEKEARIKFNDGIVDADRESPLETGGESKWRKDGEYHIYNPETISLLQQACRTGNFELYKKFARKVNKKDGKITDIKDLLEPRKSEKPIALSEVEPASEIVKRFKTGAMSYGSLSREAHETLAIAMNRLGGKSNSGEGGEESHRFTKMENGDSKCSRIKQVASGRFGVSAHYLRNCDEIQIKMAQGAKPGEGGQLPGMKVYPWIAKSRNSTAGVDLISPPPHHDIYSIEDFAQLIHDLKSVNPKARIGVKLVSEAGVGTVAVGTAKGLADVILVSGYNGGTGASPRTSIRHTGLPWELGLSETHQALVLNDLRNRVTLETDGKLLTGRDVLIAALLGAEEFGFATGPLVAIGCVMMRVCNQNTCPIGVATQDPNLRCNFVGKPEYVENFMMFIAEDLRRNMAKIGVKTVNELIGHVEKLSVRKDIENFKARTVDLSGVLYQPKISSHDTDRYCTREHNHMVKNSLDGTVLSNLARPMLELNEKVSIKLDINNRNRTLGTYLSGELAENYGEKGLDDDTINIELLGSAGQSFGAFLYKGVTLQLTGDSNDYIGKGLSGGKLIIKPPVNSKFSARDNIIVGNVSLYGAISGEVYINGRAGQRFAIRNSGAIAVVEGIGENGCEYMTGGEVVILGKVGRNFAAGMSGGVAYIYDEEGTFASLCNDEFVYIEKLESTKDRGRVRELINKHVEYTNSSLGKELLENFEEVEEKFVKVIPKTYKKVMAYYEEFLSEGLDEDKAKEEAFIKLMKGGK